jgi:hypothetical protein
MRIGLPRKGLRQRPVQSISLKIVKMRRFGVKPLTRQAVSCSNSGVRLDACFREFKTRLFVEGKEFFS